MTLLRYDFGYAWPWTWGHLIAAAVFGALAAWRWRAGRPIWVTGLLAALCLWAIAGAAIVHGALRFSLPLELPTEAFLGAQTGRVLDIGAGSGRATLMVLEARPRATVVALDVFREGYGIAGNTPDRLRANVAAAGATPRLEVQAGDMREMPLADASFDAAVSAFAIDHLNRDGITRALAEVKRVLRPRGDFLLMVINPDAWIKVAMPMLHAHGYFGQRPIPDIWRARLLDAGFDVIEMGTQPGTLFVLARKPA